MKKGLPVLAGAFFLFFTICGSSLGWQGRMDGMGDPVGLVGDESDLLVHPAKAADGKGLQVFGHYGFKYTNVDWNWEADLDGGIIPDILRFVRLPLSLSYDLENDGDEWWHEALLGLTFPLGPGRMGVFFELKGEYGDYDGNEVLTARIGGIASATLAMENDVNTDMSDFALRLVYGAPVGKVNLGGEVKLAYRDEENRWDSSLAGLSIAGIAVPSITMNSTNYPITGLNRLLLPYDSDYWELSFKAGVNWAIGSVEFDLTPRVGFIFGGNNSWDSDMTIDIGGVFPFFPGPTVTNDFDMDGDVNGWNWGLDFWLRFPVTDNVSMPLLFRVDYRDKERDGSGNGAVGVNVAPFFGATIPLTWEYETEEETLEITAGGGLDIDVSKQSKIAFGLFYSYINRETNLETDMGITTPIGSINVITETDDGYPEYTEHQVSLKLAGEHAFSPDFLFRAGLNLFYGWVEQEYDIDGGANILGVGLPALVNNTIELDGHHWGIDHSVGASVMFDGFAIEPFINGGYHNLSLDGDEEWNAPGIPLLAFDVDTERSEWFIGAGFTVYPLWAGGSAGSAGEQAIQDGSTAFSIPELDEGLIWEDDWYRVRLWGELRHLITYNSIDDNSLLNPDDIFAMTRFGNEPEAELKLDANILDMIGIYGRGRVRGEFLNNREESSVEYQDNLDQAYVTFEYGDEIKAFLSIGKQRVKWGTGLYWFPVDTFNPLQDLEDKEEIEEGKICYRADVALPGFSLTGVVVPDVESTSFSLDNFVPEGDKTLFAGNISTFLWNTDLSFYVSDRKNEAIRWGSSFSTVISDIQFFGEGVFWKGRSEKYYPYIESGRSRRRDPFTNIRYTLPAIYDASQKEGSFYKFVLGLQYTFSNDLTVIAEYYHTNDGYDEGEMDTYVEGLEYAGGAYEDDVASTVLARRWNPFLPIPNYPSKKSVLSDANSLYNFANLRRHYFHLSLRKPDLFNRFDLAMDTIINLDDLFENRGGSLFLRPSIAYKPTQNWRLTLYSQMNIGANDTDFGMQGYDFSMFFWTQFFF